LDEFLGSDSFTGSMRTLVRETL